MPGRINAEIARNHGGPVHHAADGQAFGYEPVVDLGQQFGLAGRHRRHPDQDRGQPLARRLGQPVFGQHFRLGRVEGALRQALRKGGVGHKLGVAFPFQRRPADRPLEMRSAGLRMGAAVAVKQRQKMRQIARPVAVVGLHRLLDRNVKHA